MNSAVLVSRFDSFAAALATDSTSASFPSLVPTVTSPVGGNGVLSVVGQSGVGVPNNLLLVPYGDGASNDTFSVRVVGWRQIGILWVPTTLCELLCQLGLSAGVAAAPVTNAQLFADTITLTTGNANVDNVILSPADDTIAHAVVDIQGCKVVQVTCKKGTTTAGMNCLYAGL